jgi:group I intron endonuclease
MIGVYMITNPKGRVYVGQSKDIENRFKQYRYNHFKKQPRLYNSIQKHGYEAHNFQVICECKEDELNNKERYYQEKYNVLGAKGLNCELVSSNNAPKRLSEESKRKISVKNKGTKNGMYGRKMSEEFKINRRNYKHTKEALQKISTGSKGGNNPNSKLVLCLKTGIFYECIGEAAESLNIPYDRLKQWLNGRRKNKSSLNHV